MPRSQKRVGCMFLSSTCMCIVYSSMYTYIYIHISTCYIHTCMHAYTYIHTHAHTLHMNDAVLCVCVCICRCGGKDAEVLSLIRRHCKKHQYQYAYMQSGIVVGCARVYMYVCVCNRHHNAVCRYVWEHTNMHIGYWGDVNLCMQASVYACKQHVDVHAARPYAAVLTNKCWWCFNEFKNVEMFHMCWEERGRTFVCKDAYIDAYIWMHACLHAYLDAYIQTYAGCDSSKDVPQQWHRKGSGIWVLPQVNPEDVADTWVTACMCAAWSCCTALLHEAVFIAWGCCTALLHEAVFIAWDCCTAVLHGAKTFATTWGIKVQRFRKMLIGHMSRGHMVTWSHVHMVCCGTGLWGRETALNAARRELFPSKARATWWCISWSLRAALRWTWQDLQTRCWRGIHSHMRAYIHWKYVS